MSIFVNLCFQLIFVLILTFDLESFVIMQWDCN